MSQASIESRKDDHLQHALAQQQQLSPNSFDDLRFVHQSLVKGNLQSVDLTTEWAGNRHDLPFYINAMTGGSQKAKRYNQQLAEVAAETGLTMAVGSLSAALKNPALNDSFTVIRQANPKGFVLANLGAHHSLDNAQRAVELIQADALQIHLNSAQELVMPEGDRDFTSWLANIERLVTQLDLPVIVKEVGFGMSRETIEILQSIGVQTIDLGGRGGTNFVKIEDQRNQAFDFSALNNWGQTTVESLLESLAYQNQMSFLASGGIRHFLDIVKALALGAKACGIAGKFLHSVDQFGVSSTIQLINDWETAIKRSLLLLNCQSIDDLKHYPILVMGESAQWAHLRQIDLQSLANRR